MFSEPEGHFVLGFKAAFHCTNLVGLALDLDQAVFEMCQAYIQAMRKLIGFIQMKIAHTRMLLYVTFKITINSSYSKVDSGFNEEQLC